MAFPRPPLEPPSCRSSILFSARPTSHSSSPCSPPLSPERSAATDKACFKPRSWKVLKFLNKKRSIDLEGKPSDPRSCTSYASEPEFVRSTARRPILTCNAAQNTPTPPLSEGEDEDACSGPVLQTSSEPPRLRSCTSPGMAMSTSSHYPAGRAHTWSKKDWSTFSQLQRDTAGHQNDTAPHQQQQSPCRIADIDGDVPDCAATSLSSSTYVPLRLRPESEKTTSVLSYILDLEKLDPQEQASISALAPAPRLTRGRIRASSMHSSEYAFPARPPAEGSTQPPAGNRASKRLSTGMYARPADESEPEHESERRVGTDVGWDTSLPEDGEPQQPSRPARSPPPRSPPRALPTPTPTPAGPSLTSAQAARRKTTQYPPSSRRPTTADVRSGGPPTERLSGNNNNNNNESDYAHPHVRTQRSLSSCSSDTFGNNGAGALKRLPLLLNSIAAGTGTPATSPGVSCWLYERAAGMLGAAAGGDGGDEERGRPEEELARADGLGGSPGVWSAAASTMEAVTPRSTYFAELSA